MPFKPEFDDLYELGIKPACVAAGAECARVDEQIFNEEVLARTYRQIERADLVLGEMSDQNPNVYFEVGYAKGQRKNVLLVTRDADGLPFDLRGYRHLVYGGKIAQLRADVEENVRALLDPSVDDGPHPIAGLWTGDIVAKHPNPIVTVQPLTMEFRWIGYVVGDGTIEVPGAASLNLRFAGEFRYDRFLMLTYDGGSPGVMQFGGAVLRLNGTGDRLEGHYTGYGAVHDSFVYGAVTLNRR